MPAPVGAPTKVGRYEIRRELGQGGMGTVHEAFDPQEKRSVALKLPELRNIPDGASRFRREIAVVARINHPGFCRILDQGEHAGQPFYVMELVDGKSLDDEIRENREFEVGRVVRLVGRLARAMAAFHAADLIHRDLKPGNIMIRKDNDDPVIVDYGLARPMAGDEALTLAGQSFGSPSHMSPEQQDNNPNLTCVSDVFSLGVIFYQLLVGKHPFPELIPRHGWRDHSVVPVNPATIRRGIDPALGELCLRAIRRDPDERFASMTEFADALANWEAHRSGTTRISKPAAKPVASSGPSRAAFYAAVGAAILMTLVTFGLIVWAAMK